MFHLADESMMCAEFPDLNHFTKQVMPAFRYHRRIFFQKVLFGQVEFLKLINITAGTFAAKIILTADS